MQFKIIVKYIVWLKYSNLSQELVSEYGRGYSQCNLFNMVKLYEVLVTMSILHTLCTKLTWSHFRKLIYIKEPLKMEFCGDIF